MRTLMRMSIEHPNEDLVPLVPMAERIGVRPHDLRADATAGTMPHVRVGKTGLLFDPARVFAVLADRARKDPAEREERPQ
jgi:hypothetical protein